MKKIIFSAILIGTIVVSGLAGYANEKGLASKQTELGSIAFPLNILDK